MRRSRFIVSALASSSLAPLLLGAAPRLRSPAAPLERALVLSGGGARGVYEAGVVGALAAAGKLSDGSRLLPYEVVCGSSIGALNGWFVATAQYDKLRALWYEVAAQDLVQLKSRYAALRDDDSGVIDRAFSALSLIGLVRDQSGVVKSEPVYDWIVRTIDPQTPLVLPLVWAVTNLTHERPEYFFVRPARGEEALPAMVEHALRIVLGPHTVVREATPEILHRALFASAAIPIVFDPVVMEGPDGTLNSYCDGGVASNSPVAIAHALASAADVILLDPPLEPQETYRDAVEIAFAAFGTMQRKILEGEMRNAYLQTLGKRALANLSPADIARASNGDEVFDQFIWAVPATDLRYVRPAEVLPLGVAAFDDETGIGKAYRLGWEDIAHGFTPYDWQTFRY